MILRSCPRCGAGVKPDDKFCGRCGSPLGTGLPGSGPEAGQPVSPAGETGARSRKLLIAAAAVVAVLLIIAAGYTVLKSPQNVTGSTGIANQSAGSGSYVIVVTEEPAATSPTIPVLTTATTVLTTSPTTPMTTKARVCPADRLLCNTTCIDARTDNSNCGFCGKTCPGGQTCVNGNCLMSCSSGKTSCPGGCYNLLIDPDHCGTCLNNCPAGLICSGGQCTAPDTPMQVPV